jgi:hypothetical protein
MKKIIAIICLAALVISAQAQTNVQTFFTSAQTFLTDFNTNYTFTNITFEASTGLKQVTGAGATDVVNAQGDNMFGTGLELGASVGFEGVGSTIGTAQAIIGYGVFRHYDAKVALDLECGYSWYQSAYVVEPELVIEKKLTANTFLRIGVSAPIYSKGSFGRSPSFETGVGFTF